MAQHASVDLLDGFRSIRGAEVIVFTSYTFDPVYFDNAILPKLLSNNPDPDIIVLTDPITHRDALENGTEATGRDYIVLPVDGGGVFHPKLYLALGPDVAEMRLGSHNLTAPGLTSNLEVTGAFDAPSIIQDVADYIERLFDRAAGKGTSLRARLPALSDYIGDATDEGPNNGPVFLHNLDRPILPQLLETLPEASPHRLVVVAPYHGSGEALLDELVKDQRVDELELWVQPQAHTLDKVPDAGGVPVQVRVIEDPPRRLHAKVYVWTGDAMTTAIGSANFTRSALLATADSGNHEAMVVMPDIDMDLRQEIRVSEPTSKLPPGDPRPPPGDGPAERPAIVPVAATERMGRVQVHIGVRRETDVEVVLKGDDGKVSKRQRLSETREISFAADAVGGGSLTVEVRWEDQRAVLPVHRPKPSQRLREARRKAQDPDGFTELLASVREDEEIMEALEGLFYFPPEERTTGRPKDDDGGGKDTSGDQDRKQLLPGRRRGPTEARPEAKTLRALFKKRRRTGDGGSSSGGGPRDEADEGDDEDDEDDDSGDETGGATRDELQTAIENLALEAFRPRLEQSAEPKWVSHYLRSAFLLSTVLVDHDDYPFACGRALMNLEDATKDIPFGAVPESIQTEVMGWLAVYVAAVEHANPERQGIAVKALRPQIQGMIADVLDFDEPMPDADALWETVSASTTRSLPCDKQEFLDAVADLRATMMIQTDADPREVAGILLQMVQTERDPEAVPPYRTLMKLTEMGPHGRDLVREALSRLDVRDLSVFKEGLISDLQDAVS